MGDFSSRNWYILFNVKISRSSENLHRVYSPICNKLSLSFSDAVRRCRTTAGTGVTPVPLCVSTLSLYYVIPVQKHIPLFKICNCIFVLSLLFAEIRTKQRSGCVLTSSDV